MRTRILAAGFAMVAALLAQQSSQQSSVYTLDVNGHRVEGPHYSVTEAPSGSQRIESAQSINGRMVPIQSAEDRVLREDSQGKVVERVIRKYDPSGTPGQPIKVRIEEKKNPDGSTTIQSTAYEADINGNLQVFERSTSQIRKNGATETSTTVERATLNGALQPVERDTKIERPTGSGSQVESVVYRRDVSGNFTPFAQEVKQITKSGAEETTDAARYELGPDGKLTLASRAIDHVKTNPDGSQVADSDVYSIFSAGRTVDLGAPANQPRLQEQVHKERTPGPGGKMIETTSVRARLPNDQSSFGAYEKVSQTTYTATDPGGREIKSSSAAVSRRNPNGDLVVDYGQVEQSVATKK
jgi:hypothetical protein